MSRTRARDRFESTCRQIAPKLLRATEATCDRLADASDDEALHDFRVAARRLRTHLEAQRDHLGRGRSKRLRKALSDLVTSTNASRDFEVHREWLQEQISQKGLPTLQREGLEWMLAERYSQQDPALRQATTALIRSEFTRICQQLETEDWLAAADGPTGATDQGMTAAAHEAICKNLRKLRTQLARIRSVDDVQATHRARLAVKRLRYLLEPLRLEAQGAPRVIEGMKQLQDILGDLRDLQILETQITVEVGRAAGRWSDQLVRTGAHDPRVAAITRGTPESRTCYALAAGMQRVRREEQRQFDRAKKRWLKGHAEALIARIEKVANHLRPSHRNALRKTRKVAVSTATDAREPWQGDR
ncbi:MAG: CHAD domain-containing protein [Gemmatimonadetes bacterium]|nr:CHAD domain-containing protein [Gemmatimonadota bacterium]